MESLHQELLIVKWVNALLGPVVAPALEWFNHYVLGGDVHLDPSHAIPDYLVMSLLIVTGYLVLGLVVRSRLSVEHPNKFQIALEDLVSAVAGLLDQWLGPKGRQFLPLIGALGGFILVGNYLGLVPGFMAPTSNLNVTVGCAITTWVYYHIQGVRVQGLVGYVKHFAGPPGVPALMIPLMFVIEIISHLARVLSLSLRLFGNIFGEELVIAILALLFAWGLPLPIMVLGLVTGGLQAFIFVLLSIIYLQGAVVVEHHEHGEADGHGARDARPAAAAA
jgi:F-type H+-transporting ATPase subunit a